MYVGGCLLPLLCAWRVLSRAAIIVVLSPGRGGGSSQIGQTPT